MVVVELRTKNLGTRTMSMFAGIAEVDVKKKNRYIEPGNYVVEISAVKSGTKNQTAQPYFVAELDIIESDNPDFAPGDTVTWMTMVHQYRRYFLEQVKGFVATTMDAHPEEVTEEVMEYVVGEDQPLVGKKLSVRAFLGTNQKTGKTYCESEFRLISE